MLDYSIALPDGSIFTAPHENAYAEWGSVTVHHQYVDGPGSEVYEVGLWIQPANRSYQADFFFILQNIMNDGTLVSSADIYQTPTLNGATYVNAYLDVFDYTTFTSKVNVRFSVDTLRQHQIPEPASPALFLMGIGGLYPTRKRIRQSNSGRPAPAEV